MKNETFFVCVYMKSGRAVGHALSPKNEFSASIEDQKIVSAENKSVEDIASEFDNIFDDYCNSILSYFDIMPLVASIAPAMSYQIRSVGFVEFLDEKSVKKFKFDDREIFEVPAEYFLECKEISDSADKVSAVGRQIPKMFIIGIVSAYELHLSRLVRNLLLANPSRLNSSDRHVSVREVFESSSIDAFKEMIIEKEIDIIMRSSFEDQISWIEKAVGIKAKIKESHGDWPKLVEIFERRNLFAHTNGLINDRYLKKAVEENFPGHDSLVKGKELFAAPKYFNASLEIICEFGVKLIQVCWRKIEKTENEIADSSLSDFGFNLIERGNYGLAIKVLEFFFSLDGKKRGDLRLMSLINLSNAYKLNGDAKKAIKVLDQEDLSTVNDDFKICIASIREDCTEVVRLMEKMGKSWEYGERVYEEWPVFFHVRGDKRFISSFEKLFGRKYVPGPTKKRGVADYFKNKKEDRSAKKRNRQPKTISLEKKPDGGY